MIELHPKVLLRLVPQWYGQIRDPIEASASQQIIKIDCHYVAYLNSKLVPIKLVLARLALS